MANIVPGSVLKYTGYLSIPIYKYGASRWNEALNEAMEIIDAWAQDRGTEIKKARGAASELDGRLTPMEDGLADVQSFLEDNSSFSRQDASHIDLVHSLLEWALQQGQAAHTAIARLRSGGAYQRGTVSFSDPSDPDFRSDFVSVSLSPPMPDSEYRVHLAVADGSDPERMGELIAYDRATNGFKIRISGGSGGTVRWSVIDPRSM